MSMSCHICDECHMDNLSHASWIIIDGAFSIDFGLDLLGVAGLICWAESSGNLQPALKRWSDKGASAGSPMPKSDSFKKELNCG